MKTSHSAFLFLCFAVFLSGCTRKPHPPQSIQWNAMGTYVSVQVAHDDAAMLEHCAVAKATVAAIERELSAFTTNGTVGQLNVFAGTPHRYVVTPHVRAVFDLSGKAIALSGGRFDPTVGPLMALWGFRGTNRMVAIPDEEAIRETLRRVGWDKIDQQKFSRGDCVRLSVEGMRLDFGAVAKGYAGDVVYDTLRGLGMTNVLVNIGGNMRASGDSRVGRKGWYVAVRDPYLPMGEGSVGTLTLAAGRATATSGRYEQFVEIDGKRYAHIIDAVTGHPVEGVAQVTVVADTAGEADVLSTMLFLLGYEEGVKMLKHYPGAEALFILEDTHGRTGRLFATEGFMQEFEPAKNSRF